MQDDHLFEYAVIRVVPQVEREEFINVGVVLYCAKHKFLQTIYKVDEQRFQAFPKPPDLDDINANLLAFERICMGDKEGGLIAGLDLASRFRWLTAIRSTVVQTSRIHPGMCKDPQGALERLFEQMVL